MRKALMIMILCMMTTMSVMAGEDYSDGDRQQVYVWIQEGDARFCYQNNGGTARWSLALLRSMEVSIHSTVKDI